MARLASEAKGGYFPTPPKEMEYVCSRVKCDGLVNLFDPCCGTGEACKQLSQAFNNVKTYGVELEYGRAKEARSYLDHVLACSYDEIRCSNESMNCVWLNPPYGLNIYGKRMELTFFRNIQKYVMPGGLIMFCVPRYTLGEMADAIAGRLRDVRVYLFSDENYLFYNQVVVFGYKKRDYGGPDTRKTKEYLCRIASAAPDHLPRLNNKDDGIIYEIPAAKRNVELFRSSEIKEEEIVESLIKSMMWKTIDMETSPPPPAKPLKRPLSPLKPELLAVAMSAGAVGGNLSNHIVKGVTEQEEEVEIVSSETQTGTRTDEITTKRYVSKLRIYSSEPGHEGVFTIE